MLSLSITWKPAAVPASAGTAPLEVWKDNTGSVCAYGYSFQDSNWIYLPNLGHYRFHADHQEVTVFAEPKARQCAVEDAFYRSVLPIALQERGYEALHASGIYTQCGVVALCAISETGKSTLSVALARAGYPLWSDDAVALSFAGQPISTFPIRFRTRLRPASAAFFAQPEESEWQCERSAAPLRCVFVLRRHSGPVAITQLKSSSAFREVLQHAYCFSLRDQQRKARMMSHYLQLANEVPVYELAIPDGLSSLSNTVSFIADWLEDGLNK